MDEIPAMEVVGGADAKVGQTLWGWWQRDAWHVLPAGEPVRTMETAPLPSGGVVAFVNDYVFDNRSRLLMEKI